MADSQSRLLAAIFSMEVNDDFDRKGLEAYQKNLQANTSRALSISYPVVYQLLGQSVFNPLSHYFVRESPPQVGDWGLWGHDFPEWLESKKIIDDLPYISDCARLDWLCHMLERAEDIETGFDTFQHLNDDHAGTGQLCLNPTATIIEFDFPVVDIWQAHQLPEEQRTEYMAMAREKLHTNPQQTALIWRKQWQLHARALNKTERLWLQYLQSGHTLEEALNRIDLIIEEQQCPPFLFEQWLPGAIEEHVIIRFDLNSDT
ncbi:hypothetical protein ACH42_04720 [Endozoicomonas sp. (ex Bugula neritina AB1)]|nr:hypothetical protein ACH42_04720 [Endozoicomonas sp. (ex Bugula neritina AB1)]